MQLQNIEFLKQFREEDPGLPGEERQYGNILFRHFGTSRKEKYPLERFLDNKITHSGLIGEMVIKMEREERVISRRLADMTKNMQRVLAASCRKETNPPGFIARLSIEISRFNDLAARYQDKMLLPLLNSLRSALVAGREGAGDYPGSRNIRYTRNTVRQYLDDIYHFHDVFAGFLEEEYGRTGASAVTSPAEEGLLKLTTLVKSQIFAVEATVKYLNTWGKAVRAVEVQGIFN